MEVLGRLAAVVDELASVDASTLAEPELHELVTRLHRERSRLGAVTAPLLSRWYSSGAWAADGSRTCAGRLARETKSSVRTAKTELRRAQRVEGMPAVREAVVAGRLSLDHVDLLGRVSARPGFADVEVTLVEQCVALRFADASKLVTYWAHPSDEPPVDTIHRSRLHASTGWQGEVVVDAVLEPIGGRIFLDELARRERDQFLDDQRAGVARTGSQRRAAALVEMATRSANATGRRRPKPLFTVLVGDERARQLCELVDGTVVTPRQLSPWIDSAMLETVLFDGPTTVVSVSKRRCFAGAVRRAVEVRDRRCQHPSECDEPVTECDVDHIVPRVRGGVTSQFNGRLECRTHNRHAARHDHGARPMPARRVDRLDEMRAVIRWRMLHDGADDDAGGAEVSEERRHEFTRGLYGWITHTELASTDPEATRDWCASVLGWRFQDPLATPGGEYHLFAYSDIGGGGVRATGPDELPGSTPTVHVEDARASYEAAVAAGADPVRPPTKVMDGVCVALVRAPGGVLIGFSGPTD